MVASTLVRPSFEAVPMVDGFGAPYLEMIGPHDLAVGYGTVNLALGIPLGTQQRVDQRLWVLGEKCWRTASHGRRVGGYTGAVVRAVGGPDFGTDYHVGVARVIGGVHDVGKSETDETTLHRTFGDPEYGPWDEAVDLPNIWPHPEDGAEMVEGDSQLPEETPLGIGCHHQFYDPTKPERPIYGRPLAGIDQIYRDQPHMKRWVHFLMRALVAGDTFDAVTSRTNSYLRPGTGTYDYMVTRLQPLFPANWLQVLNALQQEQVCYLRRTATVGSAEPVAA